MGILKCVTQIIGYILCQCYLVLERFNILESMHINNSNKIIIIIIIIIIT